MPIVAGLIPLIGVLLRMLVVRIIIAAGLTFVTYLGYNIALDKFKSYVRSAMNAMPNDILQLLLIGGFGQGLGYLFGAFAFTVSMQALGKLTFIAPK